MHVYQWKDHFFLGTVLTGRNAMVSPIANTAIIAK